MAYVESVRSTPFRWGSHDCLSFSNAAVEAYRGYGYVDDWLGGYSTDAGAAVHSTRLLRRHGFSGIVDAVDTRLERYQHRVPPRGSVVARPCRGILGYAFGVVVSDRAAFVGVSGLNMLRIETDDVFWRV